MGIDNIFHVISVVCTTRIMGRPVIPGVTFKIIISASPVWAWVEHRSIALTWWESGRCQRIIARVCYALDNLTADVTFLPINQASSSRMACQPVVNVALDEDLSAKLFPASKVHGFVVRFVQWRSCRDGDIHYRVHWPIWSWCACVWVICKMIIIFEGIAPN